jgi:hypothetical protein
MSTSEPKCVLCSEVGHIGKDCMANICILCLEEGHRYLECETREVVEDEEETEQPQFFLKLKDINKLLEHPEYPDIVEIVHDDDEEKTNHKFQKKMTGLLHKWKLSPKNFLKTFKKGFCGLCFIPFPSVDIALIHYKGSIHSLSMEDLKVSRHPDLWKIVLRVVEMKEPHGAYPKDIYQMMVEQYEINRFLSTKEIYQKIGEILRDMEVKYNCLNEEGERYMLKRNLSWEKELAGFSVSTMGEREGRDRGRWESDRDHHGGRRTWNTGKGGRWKTKKVREG